MKQALEGLRANKSVEVRPLGGSMRGRIESGQQVTIAPAKLETLAVGNVVFVRWKGGYLLHPVKQLRGDELLIGNNLGRMIAPL